MSYEEKLKMTSMKVTPEYSKVVNHESLILSPNGSKEGPTPRDPYAPAVMQASKMDSQQTMAQSSSVEEEEVIEVDRDEYRYIEQKAIKGEDIDDNDDDFPAMPNEEDESIFDFFKLRSHR